MQDCDPKTYSCTSSGSKDAKIAHIKRRVPLGEKTTHIDKARMETGDAKKILQSRAHIRLNEYAEYTNAVIYGIILGDYE
jgi:hypothetical protein